MLRTSVLFVFGVVKLFVVVDSGLVIVRTELLGTANVKFDCAIALVVEDPSAVNTRLVAGDVIAEKPAPWFPWAPWAPLVPLVPALP